MNVCPFTIKPDALFLPDTPFITLLQTSVISKLREFGLFLHLNEDKTLYLAHGRIAQCHHTIQNHITILGLF